MRKLSIFFLVFLLISSFCSGISLLTNSFFWLWFIEGFNTIPDRSNIEIDENSLIIINGVEYNVTYKDLAEKTEKNVRELYNILNGENSANKEEYSELVKRMDETQGDEENDGGRYLGDTASKYYL